MIAKSYITNTLIELDKLYNSSTSRKKAIYFSKLALIELCGWIEESIDDIVIRHANRNLKEGNNKNFIKNYVVKRNYGFEYSNNLRSMLISVIGLIEVEKLEKELEKTGQITLLKGYLSNLKTNRNIAAHTYLKGVTMRFNAPSLTIGDYNKIYPILENIDQELRNNS